MTRHPHHYAARVLWTGNTGQGTSTYSGYARDFRVLIAGKPELTGTADPAFRGDGRRHNPEDLFLVAIASCHMITYLALCARRGVRVVAYEDSATGSLELNAEGGGRFTEVVLRPRVSIDEAAHRDLAMRLHDEAQARCFIAASCRVPVHHRPAVEVTPRHGLQATGSPSAAGGTSP
jgi:organic hydroperoxide reductase OsmC/OhrA